MAYQAESTLGQRERKREDECDFDVREIAKDLQMLKRPDSSLSKHMFIFSGIDRIYNEQVDFTITYTVTNEGKMIIDFKYIDPDFKIIISHFTFEAIPSKDGNHFLLWHRLVTKGMRQGGIGSQMLHRAETMFQKIALQLAEDVTVSIPAAQPQVMEWALKNDYKPFLPTDQRLAQEIITDSHLPTAKQKYKYVSLMDKTGLVRDGFIFSEDKFKSLGLDREKGLATERQDPKKVDSIMYSAIRIDFDKIFCGNEEK